MPNAAFATAHPMTMDLPAPVTGEARIAHSAAEDRVYADGAGMEVPANGGEAVGLPAPGALAGMAVAAAFGFGVVLGRFASGGPSEADRALRGPRDQRRSQPLSWLAHAVMAPGSVFVHVPAALAARQWLARDPERAWGGDALVRASLGSFAVHHVVKHLVDRQRPVIADNEDPGFPSSHAASAAAVSLTAAYVAAAEELAPASAALPAAIAATVATGVSRVYLGEHWSTDVLGGWLLGASIAALVCGHAAKTGERTRV